MVTRTDDQATDALFRALADSTRRDILRRAIGEEQSISSLAERYSMSFAAVQKHVSVLERSALIGKHRRGKEQIVRARPETLRRAAHLLGEFEQLWAERIGRIDDLLLDADAPPDAVGTSSPAAHTTTTSIPTTSTSPTTPTEKGRRS
jgi:DNA-binding transcriptional ArsR family regulator